MKPAEQPTEVDYSFSKNKFSRKAKIVDQELFQQQLDSLPEPSSLMCISSVKLHALARAINIADSKIWTFFI